MWTAGLRKHVDKPTIKTSSVHLQHPHTNTQTPTHIKTHTSLGQQQQLEIRANASTKQATSVLRNTKFDFYCAVSRKSNTSRINKHNTFSV